MPLFLFLVFQNLNFVHFKQFFRGNFQILCQIKLTMNFCPTSFFKHSQFYEFRVSDSDLTENFWKLTQIFSFLSIQELFAHDRHSSRLFCGWGWKLRKNGLKFDPHKIFEWFKKLQRRFDEKFTLMSSEFLDFYSLSSKIWILCILDMANSSFERKF